MQNFKFLPLFFLLWGLTSCSSETDISHSPYAQEFVGKCLELTQDAFIIKWRDTNEYDIMLPGEIYPTSIIPVTVHDYLTHPTDWWNSDLYKQNHGPFLPGHYKVDVNGVLTKGTRLQVVKVIYTENYGGVRHTCFVEILDGPFKGIQSGIQLIDSTPYAYSQKLKMDERALKFCDDPKEKETYSKSESQNK